VFGRLCCFSAISKIILDTVVTSWLEYFNLGKLIVFGDDFRTASKYFIRNFPFTPFGTVFDPSPAANTC